MAATQSRRSRLRTLAPLATIAVLAMPTVAWSWPATPEGEPLYPISSNAQPLYEPIDAGGGQGVWQPSIVRAPASATGSAVAVQTATNTSAALRAGAFAAAACALVLAVIAAGLGATTRLRRTSTPHQP